MSSATTTESRKQSFFVTPHARERYSSRVGASIDDINAEIVSLIRAGIAAERRSKRKPRWLMYTDHRPRNRALGKLRYVWDVHEQICFVIIEQSFKMQKQWCVKTCMTRRS